MQLRLDPKRLAAMLAVFAASVAPFACSYGAGTSTAIPNPECHTAFGTETLSQSGAIEGTGGGGASCASGTSSASGTFTCEALGLAAACTTCVRSKCSSTLNRCLGPNWQSGKLGGACAEFAACACPCTTNACVTACAGKANTECKACIDDIDDCIDGPCEEACGAVVVDGGATDTGLPFDTAIPLDTGLPFDTGSFDTGSFDTAGDTTTGSGCWFIDQQFTGSSCRSCVASSCSSQMSTCAGAGWQQGEFGGTCSAYLSCICNCTSSDSACHSSCNSALTSACSSCFNAALTCREMSCSGLC